MLLFHHTVSLMLHLTDVDSQLTDVCHPLMYSWPLGLHWIRYPKASVFKVTVLLLPTLALLKVPVPDRVNVCDPTKLA